MRNLTHWLKAELHLQDYEIKIIIFISCYFISEFSKLIILLLTFNFLDHAPQFLLSVSILLSLKWVSGGLHFKTYWGCLCASFIFLVLAQSYFTNWNL